jgi:hypothetical protein
MGRAGQWLVQSSDQPVDVSDWHADDEFGIYPEGARDKALLYSPEPAPYGFLYPNHRYLFKLSFRRYPEQFWAEIVAYRIGCMMRVAVPPAFAAYDSQTGDCGALIEWFLGYPGEPDERYVPGGDIMTSMIKDFDRKRGIQHNLDAIERYFERLFARGSLQGDWRGYWCDMLLFDAIIGNTDRHQDNWGLLWRSNSDARLAPVFDNGTSLGHEIVAHKMEGFADRERLAGYIQRGTHHLRWHATDTRPVQHADLIAGLLTRHPYLHARVESRLGAFDSAVLAATLQQMVGSQLPVPLSKERATLIYTLTVARHRRLDSMVKGHI